MAAPEFDPAVVAFVTHHVRSLDELQLLMAIIQSGQRWWDVPTAAREFGIPETAARVALDRFASHNLLDIRITDDVRYQFSPGTEDLRETAHAAADAYRRHPIAIARLVPRESTRRIADFADAFRIRRDDDR
jgi:hypothetical protein